MFTVTKQFLLLFAAIAFCTGTWGNAQSAIQLPVMEGLPDHYVERIRKQERRLAKMKTRLPLATMFSVIHRLDKWTPGVPITVAFKGGNNQLHGKIASAAQVWESAGNVKFDFGWNGTSYRTWSEKDKRYAANIRISFDGKNYWSLVGRGSTNASYVGPGEASMNFQYFDVFLPLDWNARVIPNSGTPWVSRMSIRTPAPIVTLNFVGKMTQRAKVSIPSWQDRQTIGKRRKPMTI
jgi:hypothetical protein